MHSIASVTKVQRLAEMDKGLELFEIHKCKSDAGSLASDVKPT